MIPEAAPPVPELRTMNKTSRRAAAARLRRCAYVLLAAAALVPASRAASAAQTAEQPAAPSVPVGPTALPVRPESTQTQTAQVTQPAVSPQVRTPATVTLLFNRSAWLVVTDTQPATNLRVVQSTLQEGTTGAHLSPSYLTLCAAGRCSEGVKVGRGASPVEVVIDSSFRHNGEFTGNLLLASDENPAGFAPFELKVLSTTRGTRAAGAALILAGILVGVLVTVVLRHRALRLQALLPAKRLQGLIDRLERELKTAGEPAEESFSLTLARLEGLRVELSVDNLEGLRYVPGRFAAAVPATDRGSEYGDLLKRVMEEIGAVEGVLVRGVRPVMELWTAHPDHEALRTALNELDRAGAYSATRQAAQEAAEKIRADAEAGIGIQRDIRMAAAAAEDAVTLPQVREVQVAFQRTNAAIWLLWALVTWVTGIVALIATNYAFGAGLDYYKCFLWGIGVQVAGNQLQQLTPASVSTAFSISTPKTT
jgi:hypothetical protein